jgi:hypothetical protein
MHSPRPQPAKSENGIICVEKLQRFAFGAFFLPGGRKYLLINLVHFAEFVIRLQWGRDDGVVF